MVDVVDDADNNSKKRKRRKGYYTDVAHFSNINRAYRTRPGYGHPCKDFTAKEIIRFDGILMYNGVRGGDHALHHLWSDPQDCRYSDKVNNSMRPTRFLDIKKYLKYNDNKAGTYYLFFVA